MKAKLLLFFCFISFASVKAQSSVYHNFPDTNFIWVENFYGAPGWMPCCCSGICVNDANFQYFFDGDTTDNNHTYSKLYKTGATLASIAGPPSCPPWCTSNSTYYYYTHQYMEAIRHDSVAKKVYRLRIGGEELLYDFDLQVGDSARGYIGDPGLNYISSIDSMLVGSQYHKRFWLTTWNGTQLGYDSAYAFICEGIGSSTGILNQIYPVFEFEGTLICAYDNMIPVYPGNQPGCIIPTSRAETIAPQLLFSITPNPGNGNFIITGAPEDATIRITDLLGKTIFIGQCKGNQTEIILAGIPKGIYSVMLTNKAGVSGNKNLVIQ